MPRVGGEGQRGSTVTNPYRPSIGATSSDNVEFVVKGHEELPTGRTVLAYIEARGRREKADVHVDAIQNMVEALEYHLSRDRTIRFQGTSTNTNEVRTVIPLGYDRVAEVDHVACKQPTGAGDQGGMFRGNGTRFSITRYSMHLNTILRTAPSSSRGVCSGGKWPRSSQEEPPGFTGQWRDILFCTSVGDMSTNLRRKTADGQKKSLSSAI